MTCRYGRGKVSTMDISVGETSVLTMGPEAEMRTNDAETTANTEQTRPEVVIVNYEGERQLNDIMSLVNELSEPYNIFTYRYFLDSWPNLCFLARVGDCTVGSIVCKAEEEFDEPRHVGYIAMLAVQKAYRKHGIGTKLVTRAIKAMNELNCYKVVLETEVTNQGALNLYTKVGFIKEERLIKYYLNRADAFRLKLCSQ